MVTLGTWKNTPEERMGTFMHELGHTLGLDHGGDDTISFKPNYNSVMNYLWQTPVDWMYEDIDHDGKRFFFDTNGNGIQDPDEPFEEFDINGNGYFGDVTWFLDYSRRTHRHARSRSS